MNTKTNRIVRNRKQLGQGMTEYVIIVALVAIAAISVYSAFGKTVRLQVSAVTQGLAGQDGTADTQAAVTEGQTASTNANKTLGMDSFGDDVKAQ
jgi:Flp pilus assembly pilin Flp